MGRRLRYHVENGVYHVMVRGNDKQDIFFDDKDYLKMLKLLTEGVERYEFKVLAYCFMKNHIHLAIQVGKFSLSTIMHSLNSRYTRYINFTKSRVGHLFQGRFRSILVDGDRYLGDLLRYIHLNPVKAGVVSYPSEYRWSSYRDYMGHDKQTIVSSKEVLLAFDGELERARYKMEEFTLAETSEEKAKVFEQGFKDGVLGGKAFIAKIGLETKPAVSNPVGICEVVERFCCYYGLNIKDLMSESREHYISNSRAMLAHIVMCTDGLSLTELGAVVGRSVSQLSRSSTKIASKLRSSEEERVQFDEAYSSIMSKDATTQARHQFIWKDATTQARH